MSVLGTKPSVSARTEPQLDPFAAAADQIGDAWTFLITREAFFGARRFEEFCQSMKISRARLSERLKHLVDSGVLERRPYSDAPLRYEYRLTDKGLSIYPIALTLIAWGEKWRSTKSDVALVHRPCGHPLRVRMICRNCGRVVTAEDLVWPPILPLDQVSLTPNDVRGWRKMAGIDDVSARSDPGLETLRIVGDRWSMLIMYGALQTEFRFREAQAKLGIAHNILTERLTHLVQHGVLERTGPTRNAAYRATAAGRGLLDVVLAARTWGLDHVDVDEARWNRLVHKPCGSNIRVDFVCAECHQRVSARDVAFT